MNRLINVFPHAWRERYGEEFEALLEATPMSPLTVMDVLAYAARTHHSSFRERLRGDGVGAGSLDGPSPRARLLALIGLLLMLPSALFIVSNLIEHQLGVAGLADVANSLAQSGFAPFVLLGLPALGFVVTTVPLVGLRVGLNDASAVTAQVVLHVRARNLAVATAALLAISSLLLYAALENL